RIPVPTHVDDNAFQERERRFRLEADSVRRTMKGEIKMKYRFIFLFATLTISTVLYGQGRGPAAFNIDLTGMWTPPLHEDALERGNGPELADYGGVAFNITSRPVARASKSVSPHAPQSSV